MASGQAAPVKPKKAPRSVRFSDVELGRTGKTPPVEPYSVPDSSEDEDDGAGAGGGGGGAAGDEDGAGVQHIDFAKLMGQPLLGLWLIVLTLPCVSVFVLQ